MGTEKVRELEINSWKDFQNVMETGEFESWAFRGQQNSSWPLNSTLSRYFKAYKVHPDAWSRQEERIIRIFKRKSHIFLKHFPEEDNTFEWLGLMQHHGAPTRLLDFTWSPYVAAFFALEKATSTAAIWAIFPPKTFDGAFRTIRSSQKTTTVEVGPWVYGNFEKYFLPNTEPIVLLGEPYKMNQRLIAQSGTFAIPGLLDKPIEDILLANDFSKRSIVKLVLHTNMVRREIMKNLYAMNITNATLFPDLDGLAKSLALELEYHWAFDPLSNELKDSFYYD